MFDRTSSYFELTQSLFLRGGVVAHTVMELDNIEAAKKMVEEGLGVALLPRVSVAREVSNGQLAEIEVVDAPPIRRSVDAIRRKDAGSPGGVVHAFLQELEATLLAARRAAVERARCRSAALRRSSAAAILAISAIFDRRRQAAALEPRRGTARPARADTW